MNHIVLNFDEYNEILTEGNIGYVKDILTIRHYTTLSGLLSILKDNCIKAQQSDGDEQWEDMADIGENTVVSFLDSRYDDEKQYLASANKNNTTMKNTSVLGWHLNEICAYIEYDFDSLPQNIRDKADFVKFLETAIEAFVEGWNWMIKTIEDWELDKNINSIEDFESYVSDRDNPDYDLPGCCFRWHDVYDDAKGWTRNIHFGEQYKKQYEKDINDIIHVIKRHNLKAFSDYDTETLLNACIADDKDTILTLLKSHGWRKGDENNPYLIKLFVICEEAESLASYEINFLKYIAVKYFRSSSKYIPQGEIRIACDMPINLPGCTIHIFDNVAKVVAKNANDISLYDRLMEIMSNRRFRQTHKIKIHK